MSDKKEITNILKKKAMMDLLNYFTVCPQVIKPGIGLEAFVEDLNKAAIRYAEYTYVEPPKKDDTAGM